MIKEKVNVYKCGQVFVNQVTLQSMLEADTMFYSKTFTLASGLIF